MGADGGLSEKRCVCRLGKALILYYIYKSFDLFEIHFFRFLSEGMLNCAIFQLVQDFWQIYEMI
jgi:hypothetical protein